jgi:hypothetical protein
VDHPVKRKTGFEVKQSIEEGRTALTVKTEQRWHKTDHQEFVQTKTSEK